MKNIVSLAAGAIILSSMSTVALADRDAFESRERNIANQKELIETQCQGRDREAIAFSTLLGPPNNYRGVFPVMGPLAGELEYIPSFRGEVLSKTFGIIETAAQRRARMLRSRALYRDIYNSEKDSQKNTDWAGFTNNEIQKAEQRSLESIRYISNKAVQDVQEVLNRSTVFIKLPYKKSSGVTARDKNRFNGGNDRSLTHIEKSAARVLTECRSYWASGFEAVQGKALLQSADDLRREQSMR